MNKLVGQYNNTYHHSIGKNPVDAAYSSLTKDENCSRKISVIDSVLKTNPWTRNIKDSNGGKNNRKLL